MGELRYSKRVAAQLTKLGGQLQNARIKARLSQADIATQAGLTRQLVSRIEAGNSHGEIGAVAAYADALGLRLSLTSPEPAATGVQSAHDLIASLRAQPLRNPTHE
ncbi:helix-turn-helix domain-containing protein [Mycobacteroides abscessus]|uniref:helix-turn-helix domain-containing protein n=1 Tax=Mycobacteroides abscessus TaxID=36809 RepID=UPI0009A79188|nr:helix-turn-helix transcriptional regulator [Mycobacteroides abscessus]SKK33987.1 transcriptional regulator, y4mF family [Mycobacteroides abscessus subsp. abscessus]